MEYIISKDEIAHIVYEADRIYRRALGERPRRAWEGALDWEVQIAKEGVNNIIRNPEYSSEIAHDEWMAFMKERGWTYGMKLDRERKEHPDIVEYRRLPSQQRVRDTLVDVLVRTLLGRETRLSSRRAVHFNLNQEFVMKPVIEVDEIAHIIYEVNRLFCAALGDHSQPRWADVQNWQVKSIKNGISRVVTNPSLTPEKSHKNWLRDMELDGWKYGEKKDVEKKEHPCMVEYEKLPEEQKVKDKLFTSIVKALLCFESADVG
jgi:hypothetical protein